MKTAKTFRLSNQALDHLRFLTDVTGANETAIVEIALVHYSQALKGQSLPVSIDVLRETGEGKRGRN